MSKSRVALFNAEYFSLYRLDQSNRAETTPLVPATKVGDIFTCKARDDEERRWYSCEVTYLGNGKLKATSFEDDFTWDVQPIELEDPTQFRF
jgi:hypothetical protein